MKARLTLTALDSDDRRAIDRDWDDAIIIRDRATKERHAILVHEVSVYDDDVLLDGQWWRIAEMFSASAASDIWASLDHHNAS